MKKLKELVWYIVCVFALTAGAAVMGFTVMNFSEKYAIAGLARMLFWLAESAVATPLFLFVNELSLRKENGSNLLTLICIVLTIPALPCLVLVYSVMSTMTAPRMNKIRIADCKRVEIISGYRNWPSQADIDCYGFKCSSEEHDNYGTLSEWKRYEINRIIER